MQKLTRWYPPTASPAYIGVYEKRGYSSKAYQYWNGEHWLYGGPTIKNTIEMISRAWICKVENQWRGLAKKP